MVTWPVATTVDAVKASSPSTLLWNVASTLGGTDQAIDVQAVFTDNATPTPTTWTSTNPPTVIVDRAAFGESYATDDLGPGSVSLVTGNYSVTATDVQVPGFNGDMTVRRSFNSFAPAVSGPFGPGWVLSLGVDTAGSSWSAVTDLGSFVKASEADGGALYFAVQADGTHEPFADTAAAGLTLPKAGSGTGTKYTVADTDGNSTVFAYASGTGTPSTSNAWRYRVESVVQPGMDQPTTTAYNGDGTPFRMLAPPSAGQDCSDDNNAATFQPGCRAVKFFYTTGKITSVGTKFALAETARSPRRSWPATPTTPRAGWRRPGTRGSPRPRVAPRSCPSATPTTRARGRRTRGRSPR